MIDFYYWPTPNGWKVSIMLEECELDYRVIPVDIRKGEQFSEEFLAISPNNRMPAIVDNAAQPPVSVFESGAILWYLAEKTGRFLPQDPLARKEVMEWLFWQVGNQGPMAGQLSHFVNYAPAQESYSRTRYANEYDRCLGVLEQRLHEREYIARPLGQSLEDFPNVSRWRNAVKVRPAVQRGVDLGKSYRRSGPPSDAERSVLFNQTSRTLRKP